MGVFYEICLVLFFFGNLVGIVQQCYIVVYVVDQFKGEYYSFGIIGQVWVKQSYFDIFLVWCQFLGIIDDYCKYEFNE